MAVASIVIVGATIAAVLLIFPGIPNNIFQAFYSRELPVSVLQPSASAPRIVPQDQLVQYALTLINQDRQKAGLGSVKLSNNLAAQVHAEDVFSTKQISHWMTDGEKPYMVYTRYNGTGNVHQNIAITGFTPQEYSRCVSLLSICETVDPIQTIKDLENRMLNDDVLCCANGHRDNILDSHHTDVSIGIVYDRYFLVFVENFEDNYGLVTTVNNGMVNLKGHLSSGTLDQLQVNYDELPTASVYDQNKNKLSYTGGTIIALVAKPLGFGYYYQQPQGYNIIQASNWNVDNSDVDISFPLAKAVSKDGVYTIQAVLDDGEGKPFDATSYSIFVRTTPSG
jgi:Cysteine-rich secretory protein family